MNETVVPGLILVAIGVVTIICATLDWRIVNRSGKLLNRIFGDMVARAIYGAVGTVLIVLRIGRLVA